jgi:hypothetical protein
MNRALCFLLALSSLSVAAGAEPPPGIPESVLAMVPEDRQAIRMIENGDARWKIYFVVDRRLLRDVDGTFVADIAMKLRLSSRATFEARCSAHSKPVCVFTKAHDFASQPLSISATLFVIRGDGCIYSAGRSGQDQHTESLYCVGNDESMPTKQLKIGIAP